MKDPKDFTREDIALRKSEARQERATMPFVEKVAVIERMQRDLRPIRENRGPKTKPTTVAPKLK